MSIPHYKECLRAGLKLIPLVGKRPIWKGWQNETALNRITNPDDGRLWEYDAFGWQIPKGYCVVDVDKPKKFKYQLMEGHTASQITQSGGSHYLCKLPRDTPVEYSHEWGEILTHPRQVKIYQLSDDWLRGEIETLPQAFWGNSQTNGSASSECLRYKEYSTENPGEGNRNNKLTELAGMWFSSMPLTQAIEKTRTTGLEWGLEAQEIENLINQWSKWSGAYQEPPQPNTEPPPENAFKQDTFLATEELPEITFWHGPFGPGQAVQVFGPSGCGKSYYTLEQIYETGQKVAWLDGELTWQMLKKRQGQPTGNVYFAKPEPNEWMEWNFNDFSIIVIDTHSALYRSAESENTAEHWQNMNTFISAQVNAGRCVVLVHHSGKDTSLMGRGSTAGQARFDTIIGMEKNKAGDKVKVFLAKDRHGLMWPKTYHEMIEGGNGRVVFVEET